MNGCGGMTKYEWASVDRTARFLLCPARRPRNRVVASALFFSPPDESHGAAATYRLRHDRFASAYQAQRKEGERGKESSPAKSTRGAGSGESSGFCPATMTLRTLKNVN